MTEENTEDWNSSIESTPVKPQRVAGQKRVSDTTDDNGNGDDDSNGGLEVGSPFDPAKEVSSIMSSIANSKRNKRRANAPVPTPTKNSTVASTKSENIATNKKDDSKKKSKSSSNKSAVPSSSSSSSASNSAAAAAAAAASWSNSTSIASKGKQQPVPVAAASSSSSARSTTTGGGYKKKLIRLFSTNAGDPHQAAEIDAKVQFEHEKAAMLAEHKAHADSLDRQIFEMQLALNEAKQELALSNEERDAWKARCLNQKQKIEQLEADAVKVSKMMALHQYVPGHAFHNIREPSFCPDY